jgi:hypothetical protein
MSEKQEQDVIWNIKLEKEFKTKILQNVKKCDKHLNKIFKTTRNHALGEDWAGIVDINTPVLSVICGLQSIPLLRYKVQWVNLKTRDRQLAYYEVQDLLDLIKSEQVIETDGYEKAPAIYPRTCQVPYGSGSCKIGEERLNWIAKNTIQEKTKQNWVVKMFKSFFKAA